MRRGTAAVLLAVAGLAAAAAAWHFLAGGPAAPAPGVRPQVGTASTEVKPLDTPDPAGGPAGGRLTGTWRAVAPFPDGAGRWTVTFTVVDARHAVWRTEMDGPGLKVVNTQRVRYELGDGELTLTTLERFSGEEPLELRERDKKPRVYAAVWSEAAGRPVLELVSKTDPDHPLARVRLTPLDAGATPGAAPEVLLKPRAKPVKEPAYRTKEPLYLELAFGPEAAFRVWLALDGDLLYVDRNGNGDLTDDGEPVRSLPAPAAPGGDVTRLFDVGRLADPGRKAEYTELLVTTLTTRTGVTVAAVKGRVGSGHYQRVGPTDLVLRRDPAEARLVHFDGAVPVLRPVLFLEPLDANKPTEFRVELGYPGVGAGSFAVRSVEEFPRGANPVAAFEFSDADPKRPPLALRVKLERREAMVCTGEVCLKVADHFLGTVAVPEGVGKGPARVTLSFPDCPAGRVEPRTYEVFFKPKAPAANER